MKEADIIQQTAEYVKEILSDAETGHDWWHAWRVWNNTKLLLQHEKADRIVCQVSALLHDIADPKFHERDEAKGPSMAAEFLKSRDFPLDKKDQIIYIIKNISFTSSFDKKIDITPELAIVMDADRLDALGAIGIARAFNYGGYRNRTMYDPAINPLVYQSSEEYRKSHAPTINHFYEKLLSLKDKMNTLTGKNIAEERHRFMEHYLERFLKEWNGEL